MIDFQSYETDREDRDGLMVRVKTHDVAQTFNSAGFLTFTGIFICIFTTGRFRLISFLRNNHSELNPNQNQNGLINQHMD